MLSWDLSFTEEKELGHRGVCVAQGLDGGLENGMVDEEEDESDSLLSSNLSSRLQLSVCQQPSSQPWDTSTLWKHAGILSYVPLTKSGNS